MMALSLVYVNKYLLINCRYSLPDEKHESEEAADKEATKLGRVEVLYQLAFVFIFFHLAHTDVSIWDLYLAFLSFISHVFTWYCYESYD